MDIHSDLIDIHRLLMDSPPPKGMDISAENAVGLWISTAMDSSTREFLFLGKVLNFVTNRIFFNDICLQRHRQKKCRTVKSFMLEVLVD